MAYQFDGVNQNITALSAPATVAPLTMALHFNKTASNFSGEGMYLRNSSNVQQTVGFYFSNTLALRAYIQAGAGISDFAATGTFSLNTWGHACLVLNSTTSRIIYRNGANSTTNTNTRAPTGLNRLDIATFDGTGNFDGRLADVGLWNAALTASEVSALANGVKCSRVRPQSLVFYAPFVRDLIDVWEGISLTNNNSATVTAHPRVY